MNGMKFKLLAQDIEANLELVCGLRKSPLIPARSRSQLQRKPKGCNMMVKSFSTWVKEAW